MPALFIVLTGVCSLDRMVTWGFEPRPEIQVEAMGPFVVNYLNPKDDPSKSASK